MDSVCTVTRTVVTAITLALLALALTPADAWAWTPGTHIMLGETVLRSLEHLPGSVAGLLQAFPYDFLYGSIAADTSIAKKYAEAGRHCHSWRVGFEVHDQARDDRLRAFGLGYLSHLAADVVAHNHFVPFRLAVTSSTVTLGHSYWESRFESRLGESGARRAREVILLDHGRSDALLDHILSPTIFSTQTNRRFFRGMVHVTDLGPWQRLMQVMADNSRWDLREGEVNTYLARSFDYVMDILRRLGSAEPVAFDPSGENPLRDAKRIRRLAYREGGESQVLAEAERAFGMPASALDFASRLREPMVAGARAAAG